MSVFNSVVYFAGFALRDGPVGKGIKLMFSYLAIHRVVDYIQEIAT